MKNKKLYRSRTNKVFAGIAAGMADYFEVDTTVLRAGWVIVGFASSGFAVLAYIVLIFVIPQEPEGTRKKIKNNAS